MVSGPERRRGQAAIEDIKTVSIVLMVVFVLGAMVAILGIVGSNLDQGFAHVDRARMYSGVAGLVGEEEAVIRLQLLNDYDEMQVSGDVLTLEAGFMEEGSLEVDLPEQYSYASTDFSGGEACIIKHGDGFEFRAPPCER